MGRGTPKARRYAFRSALGVLTGLGAASCAALIGVGERFAEELDGGETDSLTVDVDAPDVKDGDGADAKDADASLACDALDGGRFGGHCYFTLAPMTLEAATSACTSRGAHLATLTSQGEEDFVVSLGLPLVWIGLRAIPATNDRSKFAWITGEPVSFTAWDPPEPNENTGCVIVRDDDVRVDRPCADSYAPLCEVD